MQRPPGEDERGQRPTGHSWTTEDRLPLGLAGVSGSGPHEQAAQSFPPAAGAHLEGGMPLGRFQTCRWMGPLDIQCTAGPGSSSRTSSQAQVLLPLSPSLAFPERLTHGVGSLHVTWQGSP